MRKTFAVAVGLLLSAGMVVAQPLIADSVIKSVRIGYGRASLITLYGGVGKVDESDGHTNLFPIPNYIRTFNANIDQNPGY